MKKQPAFRAMMLLLFVGLMLWSVTAVYAEEPQRYPLCGDSEEASCGCCCPYCPARAGAPIEKTTLSGACGDNLTFVLDDGTLTISGTGDMWRFGTGLWENDREPAPWMERAGDIQSVIISEGVTSIGLAAFWNCPNLTRVVIPYGVRVIGNGAFQDCVSLEEVVLPEGLALINAYAFYNCPSLKSVTVPNSVSYIGPCALGFGELLQVRKDFQLTVSRASEGFFYAWGNGIDMNIEGTYPLKCLDVSTAARDLPVYAGERDEGSEVVGVILQGEPVYPYRILTAEDGRQWGMVIGARNGDGKVIWDNFTPESLREVTGELVRGWVLMDTIEDSVCGDDLRYSISGDGVLTISGTGDMWDFTTESRRWSDRGSEIKSIVIEEGVTSIGDLAFQFCNNLTSVSIPESVQSIGERAFFACAGLTAVSLPRSVASIGNFAFGNCTSLESLTLPEGLEAVPDNLCTFCDSLSNLVIPEGVTSIGEMAFSGCPSLASVTLPQGLVSIADHAFYACAGLTSVTLPDTVKSLGKFAFSDCSSLSSLVLSGSLEAVPESMVSGCSALTSLELPQGVTSIGRTAFAYCSNLTTITIPDSVTFIGDFAFMSCSNLETVCFGGTRAQWDAINVDEGNGWMYNARLEVK